ncbi:MAG: hypothetical protein PVI78_05350 [Anaerolineales bacterium]|jgi:hypothetical protein
MFESAQDTTDESSYFDDLDGGLFDVYSTSGTRRGFLGMTAGQRFVIALLMMGTVVVVGMLCLIVTEKVILF